MDNLTTFASWDQIISIPIAIIAVLISIWLYLRGKQKRALACTFGDIISPFEIKAGEAIKGDLKILYQDKPVENLFILRTTLKNIGNVAIRRADVIEPITFTFDPSVQLLRLPQTIYTKPENLKFHWKARAMGADVSRNVISLELELFNPNEELTVEFIYTGESALPEASARIEGITALSRIDPQALLKRTKRTEAFAVLMTIFTGFMMSLQLWATSGIAGDPLQWIDGLMTIVFVAFGMLAVYRLRK